MPWRGPCQLGVQAGVDLGCLRRGVTLLAAAAPGKQAESVMWREACPSHSQVGLLKCSGGLHVLACTLACLHLLMLCTIFCTLTFVEYIASMPYGQ